MHVDEPFTRALEATLSTFGRRTRPEATAHMVNTLIAEYFMHTFEVSEESVAPLHFIFGVPWGTISRNP